MHKIPNVEVLVGYIDIHGDLLPINNDDNYHKAVSTANPLLRIFIQRKGKFTNFVHWSCLLCIKQYPCTRSHILHQSNFFLKVPIRHYPVSPCWHVLTSYWSSLGTPNCPLQQAVWKHIVHHCCRAWDSPLSYNSATKLLFSFFFLHLGMSVILWFKPHSLHQKSILTSVEILLLYEVFINEHIQFLVYSNWIETLKLNQHSPVNFLYIV